MQDVETSINSKTDKVSVDDSSSGGSPVRLWMAKIALVVLAPILLRSRGTGTAPGWGRLFHRSDTALHDTRATGIMSYNLFIPLPAASSKLPRYMPCLQRKRTPFESLLLGESAAMGDPMPGLFLQAGI